MSTAVQLTDNVERNLADIERYLTQSDASQAFAALLDELLLSVIPNLERFPAMGRPFLTRPVRSVEASNALVALREKLSKLTVDPKALREYIMADHLLLYAKTDANIYLLAIRHHLQLSFDFKSFWRTVL